MELLNVVKKQWDRTAALGFTIVGAIVLICGWVEVSGTSVLSDQAAYVMSSGLGGIFLLAVGTTLWISADLRDEWNKLHRIEAALAAGGLRWDDARSATVTEEFTAEGVRHSLAVNGSRTRVEVAGDV
jgi:hypothetical protein